MNTSNVIIGNPLSSENIKLTTQLGRELRLKREKLRAALDRKPCPETYALDHDVEFANEGAGFWAIGPFVAASYT